MKLKVKTLKGTPIEVEIEPTSTILEFKEKLFELKDDAPAELQKLIFKGKPLDDDKTIEFYKFKEGDALVLFVNKGVKKPEPSPPTQPVQPVQPVQPTQPVQQTQPVAPVQPAPPQAPVQQNAVPDMAVGEHLEPVIAELIGMGFPREEVILALRAAFFNPERAVEYLLSEIPPNLLQQAQQAPQAHAQPQHPAQPAQNQQAQGQDEEGEGEIQVDEQTLAELQQLIQNPAFVQLRQQIRQNPQILGTLLQYLQQTNPNIYNLFQERPELLQAIIMGNAQGAEGGAGGNQQNVIRLTEQEAQDIERLMALGFDKYAAAEAYFACDKNEELAANMLFENPSAWRDDPVPAPVHQNIAQHVPAQVQQPAQIPVPAPAQPEVQQQQPQEQNAMDEEGQNNQENKMDEENEGAVIKMDEEKNEGEAPKKNDDEEEDTIFG